MIVPQRRIILWPRGQRGLEIIFLGEPHEIASWFIAIKAHASSWYGFENVLALTQDDHAIGLHMQLSARAEHTDAIAEALRMLRHVVGLEWVTSNKLGAVATW